MRMLHLSRIGFGTGSLREARLIFMAPGPESPKSPEAPKGPDAPKDMAALAVEGFRKIQEAEARVDQLQAEVNGLAGRKRRIEAAIQKKTATDEDKNEYNVIRAKEVALGSARQNRLQVVAGVRAQRDAADPALTDQEKFERKMNDAQEDLKTGKTFTERLGAGALLLKTAVQRFKSVLGIEDPAAKASIDPAKSKETAEKNAQQGVEKMRGYIEKGEAYEVKVEPKTQEKLKTVLGDLLKEGTAGTPAAELKAATDRLPTLQTTVVNKQAALDAAQSALDGTPEDATKKTALTNAKQELADAQKEVVTQQNLVQPLKQKVANIRNDIKQLDAAVKNLEADAAQLKKTFADKLSILDRVDGSKLTLDQRNGLDRLKNILGSEVKVGPDLKIYPWRTLEQSQVQTLAKVMLTPSEGDSILGITPATVFSRPNEFIVDRPDVFLAKVDAFIKVITEKK